MVWVHNDEIHVASTILKPHVLLVNKYRQKRKMTFLGVGLFPRVLVGVSLGHTTPKPSHSKVVII